MGNSASATSPKQKSNNKSNKDLNSFKRQNSLTKSNYYMPDDDIEIDRLQQKHYITKHLFDGNFHSPIHELLKSGSCKVLDLGCGPGTWVLDMGTHYYNNKNLEIVGLDISPTFPNQIKPANTRFVQANILDGLPFDNDEFDFIHVGSLGSSFTEKQWLETVLPDIFRVVKSGGWVEFNDSNALAINNGPYYNKIYEAYNREISTIGINSSIVTKYKEWLLLEPSLTNIHEEIRYLPIGSWDENDKLGQVCHDNIHTFLKILAPRLSKQLKISLEEYDQLLTKFFQECIEYKTKMPFHCVYGQKR